MYEISFMSKYQRKTRILSTFMIPFIKINNLTQYIIKMTAAWPHLPGTRRSKGSWCRGRSSVSVDRLEMLPHVREPPELLPQSDQLQVSLVLLPRAGLEILARKAEVVLKVSDEGGELQLTVHQWDHIRLDQPGSSHKDDYSPILVWSDTWWQLTL